VARTRETTEYVSHFLTRPDTSRQEWSMSSYSQGSGFDSLREHHFLCQELPLQTGRAS
jgi:hypothetical protein